MRRHRGDILVFLPGEREIRDTADALEAPGGGPEGLRHRPALLAALRRRAAPRLRTAHPAPRRTRHQRGRDLADRARHHRRDRHRPGPDQPLVGAHQGPAAARSRRSARPRRQQRSGRCGRVEAGIAIRLYSQEDFEGRPEFTEPEILRTSLASVILQMTSLGLGRSSGSRSSTRRTSAPCAPAYSCSRSSARWCPGEGDRPRLTERRPQARPAADRPAAGADDPGGRPARLPARGAGDHRGAVDPGPARATGRAAGPRRPAARAVPRPALRLHGLAQPLAPPAHPAEGDGLQRLPAGCAARST